MESHSRLVDNWASTPRKAMLLPAILAASSIKFTSAPESSPSASFDIAKDALSSLSMAAISLADKPGRVGSAGERAGDFSAGSALFLGFSAFIAAARLDDRNELLDGVDLEYDGRCAPPATLFAGGTEERGRTLRCGAGTLGAMRAGCLACDGIGGAGVISPSARVGSEGICGVCLCVGAGFSTGPGCVSDGIGWRVDGSLPAWADGFGSGGIAGEGGVAGVVAMSGVVMLGCAGGFSAGGSIAGAISLGGLAVGGSGGAGAISSTFGGAGFADWSR